MAQMKEIELMSSLRLQWRGALVVLAAWAGLAVAQAQQMPAPSSPTAKSGVPERIVTVTENGKTIRCRLVETWKLADGTTAHKLQAVESGEFITILDDPTAAPTNGKAMTKRIFHWGLKSRTPPPGVPELSVPPELMVDSGIVRTQEINRPTSTVRPVRLLSPARPARIASVGRASSSAPRSRACRSPTARSQA